MTRSPADVAHLKFKTSLLLVPGKAEICQYRAQYIQPTTGLGDYSDVLLPSASLEASLYRYHTSGRPFMGRKIWTTGPTGNKVAGMETFWELTNPFNRLGSRPRERRLCREHSGRHNFKILNRHRQKHSKILTAAGQRYTPFSLPNTC